MYKIVTGVCAVLAAVLRFAVPLSVFAAEGDPIANSVFEVKSNVLDKIATTMFTVLLALSVIMIFVAAYKYLTAGSDSEKVTSAHKTIAYAAVAIVVALIAKGFPFIICSIFGATC